jgi:hypothetical protein
MMLFVAPRVIGDDGLSWCRNLPGVPLARARAGRIVAADIAGDDAMIVVEFAGAGG